MSSNRTIDLSDLALIQKVKDTPSLYDPSNSDFKFAFRKSQIWEQISSYLGISTNDARRRWTCLRDRYSRELKQRRNNPEKVEGNDDFFNTMDFLRRFVRRRRVRRRIMCTAKEDNSWSNSNDSTNRMDTKSNSRKPSNEQNIQEDEHPMYTNKIHLRTANVEESYPEYVDDESQLTEPFDGYHMQQSAADNPTANENYSNSQCKSPPASSVHPITQRHSADSIIEESSPQALEVNHTLATTAKKKVGIGIASTSENEDDFFCKSICGYLRQLSRVHKIKAKVEMFQILEKYIELEESQRTGF